MGKVQITLSGGQGCGKTHLYTVMQEYISDHFKGFETDYTIELLTYWTPSREATSYWNDKQQLLLCTKQVGAADRVLHVQVEADNVEELVAMVEYVHELLVQECVASHLVGNLRLYVNAYNLVILKAGLVIHQNPQTAEGRGVTNG